MVTMCVGLLACDRQHPAEVAGRSIDHAAGKATDKLTEASASISNQGKEAGVALDDAAITVKVKAAIVAEPGLHVLQIGVETTKGVVTLTGSVDVPRNGARAKELAENVAGVHEVNNLLLPKIAG